MKSLRLLLLLFFLSCWFSGLSLALDRNAFTFTHYDLRVRLDPAFQVLTAEGVITLRNDSFVPQRVVALQISSTLDWQSIRSEGKRLQYLRQPYTSDIDHSGLLSEAIINLPEDVLPRGTVELEIAYEGLITASVERLTGIDTPSEMAARSDWDIISNEFTAVRGAGYVAWYPVAAEAASLSEGAELFQKIGEWKARQAHSEMRVQFCYPAGPPRTLVANATRTARFALPGSPDRCAEVIWAPLGSTVPAFALAEFSVLSRPAIDVYYLPGKQSLAADYAYTAEKVLPFTIEWFGPAREKVRFVDLPGRNDAPFESGVVFFGPVRTADTNSLAVTLVHELTHAAFFSSRAWIYEGVAHFAQALQREQQGGRHAALDYMGARVAALAREESVAASGATEPQAASNAAQALTSTTDEILYRTKAMFVWWMLRDMLGPDALQRSLRSYRAEEDTEPSYMQRLLEAQSHRDLEWFFDDWVYRDRGLPDFAVDSAFPRTLLGGAYSMTITVENRGGAGAEVPVIVRAAGGEVRKRLQMAAHSKVVTRIEVPAAPTEVVVNDGSVPESDVSNNSLRIEPK